MLITQLGRSIRFSYASQWMFPLFAEAVTYHALLVVVSVFSLCTFRGAVLSVAELGPKRSVGRAGPKTECVV